MRQVRRKRGVLRERGVQDDDSAQPRAERAVERRPLGPLHQRGQPGAAQALQDGAGGRVDGVQALERDRERRGVQQLELMGQVLSVVGAEYDVRRAQHSADDQRKLGPRGRGRDIRRGRGDGSRPSQRDGRHGDCSDGHRCGHNANV